MSAGLSTEIASALLTYFEQMLLIRRVEERLGRLFADGKIPGFVHLSIGQEAVPVGVCAALTANDTLSSTHRGHGHALAKGMALDGFFAEIIGRADGVCGGRGGSMHVAEFATGMLGANGIVGGGLSIALGSALAHQLKQQKNIAVVFFGDGAMSEGLFHECLNLAALWKLPLLMVCENNGWSEFSPTSEQFCAKLESLASAFQISFRAVDGSDVSEVASAAREITARMREGSGPWLLECKTWRWGGHYAGDPQRYRQASDKTEAASHDPLELAKTQLHALGVTPEKHQQVEEEVRQRINSSVAAALACTEPDFESALNDVYGITPCQK